MTNQISAETDLELAERGAIVEKYEALQRLNENEDFKKVITEGYLKESAIDKTSLLGTNYVRQNNLRGTLMEELVAISCLEQYLISIEQLGAPITEDDDDDIEFEG